jgi:[ribosomal protein S5]-alanine N-acetyltransferase
MSATEQADTGAREAGHPGDLEVWGRTLTLRYANGEDAPALFALASDPAVTRFFSWGPYTSVEEPRAYIAGLPEQREAGVRLDFLVIHRDDGPIGVSGLSEVSRRDRRAVVGSWFGHRWWGSGANLESKGLMAALAFRRLGVHRLSAYANTRNGRSQAALERLGFRREGVLTAWHRHGEKVHDVVIYAMTRPAWERSVLHDVPAEIRGEPPPAFVVA